MQLSCAGRHGWYLAAVAEILGEVIRQLTPANRVHRLLDIVLDAQELDTDNVVRVDRDEHEARSPVAVLRPADAPRVEEMNALDDPVPRLMRVAECDEIAGTSAGGFRHLETERLWSILGPVGDVVEWRAVNERERRPGDVTAERTHVQTKWKLPKECLGLRRHVLTGPSIAHVRQFFLPRIFIPASTVFVVRRDGRVVVAGNSLNARVT